MDDEFALCWNNFTENITTGFQNLYDRGDLIDVTLACDGKLLHAHKIVLAICSPYFQEMFITNPDKHPIIILKDVKFNVMCELLQFMYQGVVNVKQTELSSFMKIAQLLQIKGLTGSSNSTSKYLSKSPSKIQAVHKESYVSATAGTSLLTPTITNAKYFLNSNSQSNCNNDNINSSNETLGPANIPTNQNQSESKNSHSTSNSIQQQQSHTSKQQKQLSSIQLSENSSSSVSSIGGFGCGVGDTSLADQSNTSNLKRLNDFGADSFSICSRKLIKRASSELSAHANDHTNSNDSIEHICPEDVFLPPIPQITLGASSGRITADSMTDAELSVLESGNISAQLGHSNNNRDGNESNVDCFVSRTSNSRFDLSNVKREISDHNSSRSVSPTGSNVEPVLRPKMPHFNFDYNIYAAAAAANKEYPNDLQLPNDFARNTGNHMDIPAAGNAITMLSSTSLLHGSCIFNRNNTVATQQGMKTYWLCKSYRISMCRARCITHQGRVISATGVHNHPPHVKNNEIINTSLFQHPQVTSGTLLQPHKSNQQLQRNSQSPIPHLTQHQEQQFESQNSVLTGTKEVSSTICSSAISSLNQTSVSLVSLGMVNTNSGDKSLHSNYIGLNPNFSSSMINAGSSSHIRLSQNANLHVKHLPPNHENSSTHSSHLNHLIYTTSGNSNSIFNDLTSNAGIINNATHSIHPQQHTTVIQNDFSNQNNMMHLSHLHTATGIGNSLHHQTYAKQQHHQQTSPIHTHQQHQSHQSSLHHFQQEKSQFSSLHLQGMSVAVAHTNNQYHHQQSAITQTINNKNNRNDDPSPHLNSTYQICRLGDQDSSQSNQHIESPQKRNSETTIKMPMYSSIASNANHNSAIIYDPIETSKAHYSSFQHHQNHDEGHHLAVLVAKEEISQNDCKNKNEKSNHNYDENNIIDNQNNRTSSNQTSILGKLASSP